MCRQNMLSTMQILFKWHVRWWPVVLARTPLLEVEAMGLPKRLPLQLYDWQREWKRSSWSWSCQVSWEMALQACVWDSGFVPPLCLLQQQFYWVCFRLYLELMISCYLKWYFIFQEPVSVFFSALNLAMHFHGWLSFFILLNYKLPLKQDKKPYYEYATLWHIYGFLSLNSWFWSAVFHSR